ncbi:MAG: CAP domain-containing protein [Paraclostridium sp.]
MNKRLKTLLSLGVVSVLSACATFPVNAASNETVNKKLYCNNNSYGEYMCVNVQGKDCYTPVKPMSTLIQDLLKNKLNCPNGNININNNAPQNKSEGNANCKPESKPETPSTENKPSTPNVDVDAPQNKPEGNTDSKPESKPETPPTENKPSTPSGNFASFQQEVLNLVNVERTNRGLQPLKFNSELSKVATLKSQDMIDKNYFDHTSPTYGSPFDMMKQFGISYNAAGENIAMGQETPKEVMNSWMNSPGHRKNILNPDFTELGVGIASNGSSIYWTQMFIGK